MPRPRSTLRLSRRLAPGALALLLAAGLLPVPALGAAGSEPAASGTELGMEATAAASIPAASVPAVPPTAPAVEAGGEGAPGQVPSAAYEAWLQHQGDRNTFEPGARVTVGFRPRSDDRWPVGGQAPVALPAGRLSGRDLAAQGSRTLPADGSVPGSRSPARGSSPASGTSSEVAPVDAPGNAHPVAATAVGYAQPAPAPAFDLAAASGLRRQVFGFLPYWEVSGASTRLNYDVLSTIAYFSVGANGRGDLRKRDADRTLTTGWGGWTSSAMTKVINAAHQRGTRVVLTVSVFAWTTSQANVQRSLLGSSSARLNFARQVVAAVRDRGADGVNLDFEPLARGYESEFVALLKTIRSQFNKVRSGYQVTYDTTAWIGNYPLEASVGRSAADAIFVMGYDYRTSGSSNAGAVAPLSGPTYDLADTVRSYRARVPASRLILGIPWYGRAWSTATDKPRSRTVSGLKYGYSTAVNYENVLPFVAKYGRRWDDVEQSPYVVYRRQNCTSAYGCVTSWRQIWYDDATSMRRRLQLVNDYNLRGAGMWALGYEGSRSELYRALADSFLGDRSAPTAGVAVLGPTQGDEGFIVAWKAADVSPIRSYDVQVSVDGGRWRGWLTGTKATSEVYLGRTGTTYAFRVRATDAGGQVGGWNVSATGTATPKLATGGFARVTLDGLAYRTGPDTSARRLGTIRKGTVIALTRGPVSADGYTWYEATTPIREWGTVSFAERGVWIAVKKGTRSFVAPLRAPNTTVVSAGLRGFDFGRPGTPSGVGTTTAQANARLFSPNADRSRDGLQLRWTNARRMDSLKLNVYRSNGTLVGARRLSALGAGAQSWTWDGKVGGVRLKDGTYQVQLVATAAGKTYRAPSARPMAKVQLERYAVRIDTVPPVITSAAGTLQVISPNGDGTNDATRLSATASRDAVRWVARVTDAAGHVVRSASGPGASVSFTWKGTTNAGRRVPDGSYLATVSLLDAAGNAATRTGRITVDTRAPGVKPVLSARAFSPNGDGLLDTTTLSWTANEPASGSVRVVRGTTVVRSWTVRSVGSWSAGWDGRRADGSRVPDGAYTMKVDVRDAGGNRRVVTAPLVVDRTVKGAAWSGNFFPQDRDGLLATARLSFGLSRRATTTLRVYDAGGRLVRTAWSGKVQAAGTRTWTWDGTADGGAMVPQGRYLATLRVKSPYAIVEYDQWVWATGFQVVPSRTAVRPGQTLSVRIRSVEPLGAAPRVTFAQPGRAAVTVTATKLPDGSWKASFSVRSGGRGTGSVKVTAKDSKGGTNATRIAIRVAS